MPFLLGNAQAQQPSRARVAAHASLVLGVVFMAACAAAIWLAGSSLATVFTPDAEVAARVGALAPAVALFQVVDGYEGVAAGVLRGLGKQPFVAWANLVCFWVVGVPLGGWLALGPWRLGLGALWGGLLVGLVVGCAASPRQAAPRQAAPRRARLCQAALRRAPRD